MILNLAWRSILLRKQRTVITLLLSIMTTALFIFYMGLMDGSYQSIYDESIELYPGYIQVKHKKYTDDPSNEHLIFNEKETLAKLRQNKEVEAVTSRFNSFGLYASNENAIGGLFTAVDPINEPKMSNIPRKVLKGRYLNADDTTGVFIGKGLAKRLGLDINGTFSVITSGADYSFAAENLYVVGIFKTGLSDFDNMALFMNKKHFDVVMSSENIASEIIVLPKKIEQSQALAATLNQELGDEALIVEDWHTYLATLIEAMELDEISGMIMLAIFVAIIFFVVMIYAFISIYARIKEIGIMRAVGTKPYQIVQILLVETLLLATISAIIGGSIGISFSYYFEVYPIQLGELSEMYEQMELGFTMNEMPSKLLWPTVFKGISYVFVLNLIAIIYPVWKVLRFRPIDAIHHV